MNILALSKKDALAKMNQMAKQKGFDNSQANF